MATKMITVRLPKPLRVKFKLLAASRGLSMNGLAVELLERAVDANPVEPPALEPLELPAKLRPIKPGEPRRG